MNAAVDFSLFKQNELDHQDKRYGRARPKAYDKEKFAREFLLPAHKGGNARGELYARAFEKRPSGKVLDYACGKGHLAIRLAMEPNDVSAFDVSPEGIRVAREQAELSNVQVDFRVMDAEHLEYDDESFDGVIGFAALHHVIIYPRMPAELHRVMRPGAKAVFAENWGGDNPLFELWRRNTSLKKHNSSSRGEVILNRRLLDERLGAYFDIEVEAFSLAYMLKKYVSSPAVCASLYALDKLLLRLPVESFCGESIITLTKR
ncbi:MAG TPA: class I SAM-dependent methyltransferase [Gammaproteobacteria bacterium]